MTTLLEVSGVSVSFDGFRAINNLSFVIGVGELRTVIGPNGAGKTTFMDIVTDKTKPDQGTVSFGESGTNLLKMTESRIGIGRKFQRPTVFEDQTVAENLTMALKAPRGPLAVLFWRAASRPGPRGGVGVRGRAGRPSGALIRRVEPWAKAMAGDRHVAGARAEVAAGR